MKKGLIFLATIVLGGGLMTLAGYLWLQRTPWGPAMTLFADEKRAENFRAMDTIFSSNSIVPATPPDVWAFAYDLRPLPTSYQWQGERLAVTDFLSRTETTGLLVAQDGRILARLPGMGPPSLASRTLCAGCWATCPRILASTPT
jgi:hypothetical protein